MPRKANKDYTPKDLRPTEEVPQSDPTVADLERQLADLDALIAERRRQAIDAEQAEANANAQLEAAQDVRARVRFDALVDDDGDAQTQLESATDAAIRAQLGVEDRRAVKVDLANKLRDLAAQRDLLVQARANAELDAIARTRTIPLCARAGELLEELSGVLAQVKAAKLEQVQIAVAAGIEGGAAKRFSLDFVDWVIKWKLGDYGVAGVRHHFAREMTMADLEASRQGLAPALDVEDDAPEQTTTIIDADDQAGAELH